jgi:hypothetical protein
VINSHGHQVVVSHSAEIEIKVSFVFSRLIFILHVDPELSEFDVTSASAVRAFTLFYSYIVLVYNLSV